ncbi:MAG: glycosyltransferase family 9 protein [Bdellovibrionia bacterium]
MKAREYFRIESWRLLGQRFRERRLRGKGPLRILVVRPDRLGDVILSTPTFEGIKKQYPKAHLTALVQRNVLPILRGHPSVDHFLVFDPQGVHAGVRGFFRLVEEIRRRHYRIAVILQSHWKVSLAVFVARVNYRIGPLSKVHSYFLFNLGLRQRRSHVEMHEADYNLQLLRRLGARVATRKIPTQIALSSLTRQKARQWLVKQGWRPQMPLVLVHPGMGGSALNWPEDHYVGLIQALLREGKQVLLTGGLMEDPLLNRVELQLGPLKDQLITYRGSQAALELGAEVDFLAALCELAQVVVAPSTGPLHLAVALKKPVVTFYPPIRVQSAVRWGPYTEDDSQASVLVPEVYCGQENRCLGSLCNYFPCMKSLSVKMALQQVNLHLERWGTHRSPEPVSRAPASVE